MRIRVLGAGWFGCHVASAFLKDGHDVEVHEVGPSVFCGASGKVPARLHLGAPHYPRSYATQEACKAHQLEFMSAYGHLTSNVPINLYAVAKDESLVDFGTYLRVLRDSGTEFITVYDPQEFGIFDVEGAVMVGERHVVVDRARKHFERRLDGRILLNTPIGDLNDPAYDVTVDCTFCANDEANVNRFEPCLVLVLEGPTDKAVTIMDGPFPSLYPWNEDLGYCSLSSAKHSPFSKSCRSWSEAKSILDGLRTSDVEKRGEEMIDGMRRFYPAIEEHVVSGYMLSIRAMPLSAADTRLVDVVRLSDRVVRVRAGKIDAVFEAERQVRRLLGWS